MALAQSVSPTDILTLRGVASTLSQLSIRLHMAIDSSDWRKVDTILCDVESAEKVASRIITDRN